MSSAQVRQIETTVARELLPVLDRVIQAAVTHAVRAAVAPAPSPAPAVKRAAPRGRTLYRLNPRKRTLPTSPRDKQVLAVLKRHPQVTPRELRRLAGTSRNAIAGAIWRLRQGGWVIRASLP
jgi:hypothetical protein